MPETGVRPLEGLLPIESAQFATFTIDRDGCIIDYHGVPLPDLNLAGDAVDQCLVDLWHKQALLYDFACEALESEAVGLTVRVAAKRRKTSMPLYRLFASPVPGDGPGHTVITVAKIPPVRETTEALSRLTADLLGEIDVDVLLRRAVSLICEYEQVDFAHILRPDEPAASSLVATAGWPARVSRAFASQSWAETAEAAVLEDGAPRAIDDLMDAREFEVPSSLIRAGARSSLCLPLYSEDGLHAVLAAYSRAPAGFGPDAMNFVSSIANMVSQAIQRFDYQERLKHAAERDPLTNIANRRHLQIELEHQITLAARHSRSGAVLFMDLDDFKTINDALGHTAGDQFLISVTRHLAEALRGDDLLARLGGDEFAVLLRRAGPTEALAVAKRLMTAVREHRIIVGNRPVSTTVSIGIAIFPRHGATADEILAHADSAMYAAKESGRNQIDIYRSSFSSQRRSVARLEWKSSIEEALTDQRFLFYAQPVIHLADGEVQKHELLLRLRDQKGTLVLPARLLEIAEMSGLIQDVDRWVAGQAIAICRQLQAAGDQTEVAFNLSAKALGNETLALIRDEMLTSDVDASRICIEITETAAVADLRQAQRFLKSLKGLGFRLALDDFGAGFSSFSQLKNLPVDYLKIDGAFVQDLPRSRSDQHVVRAIAEVARGFNIDVIAEFVSDAETVVLLRDYGVKFGQGYYLGHPVPLDEAFPKLASAAA